MINLIIQDQFYTTQNLQRSPIPQTSNWPRTFFFAISYSKQALVRTANSATRPPATTFILLDDLEAQPQLMSLLFLVVKTVYNNLTFHDSALKYDTVFPCIVSAETIIFWKLGCDNYSREETNKY